jgi:hypothetical protein
LVPDELESAGKIRVGELVVNRESLALDHCVGPQLNHNFSTPRENPAFAPKIFIRLLDNDVVETREDFGNKGRA